MLTVLLGISALVIDVGNIMLERQKLHDALDAAVLAGAAELIQAKPNDELYQLAMVADQSELTAISYAKANGVHNPNFEINPSVREIKGTGQKKVPLFFAKVLGFEEFTVKGISKAKARPVSSGTGFSPLGVVAPDPTNTLTYGFQFDQEYLLKYDPKNVLNGNFALLDLPRIEQTNSGADNYYDNLKYGFDGMLDVEDNPIVFTKTGVIPRLTSDGINDRILISGNNYIYVPIIDALPSGKNTVTIIGFAAFYVTQVDQFTIRGQYRKQIYQGGWNNDESLDKDFGLYSVKLVK